MGRPNRRDSCRGRGFRDPVTCGEGKDPVVSKVVPRFGSSMTTTVTISGFVAVLRVALAGSSWLVLVGYVADGDSPAAEDVSGVDTVAERPDRAAERVAALAADLTRRSKGLGSEVERFLGTVAA